MKIFLNIPACGVCLLCIADIFPFEPSGTLCFLLLDIDVPGSNVLFNDGNVSLVFVNISSIKNAILAKPISSLFQDEGEK